MGTFEVKTKVYSSDGAVVEETTMLVDTGATFSLLPGSILRRLGVEPRLQVEAEYALREPQDKLRQVETVPVGLAQMEIEGFSERVPFENLRTSPVLVMFGKEGAHALEAFRLTVDPVAQTLRRPFGVAQDRVRAMLA